MVQNFYANYFGQQAVNLNPADRAGPQGPQGSVGHAGIIRINNRLFWAAGVTYNLNDAATNWGHTRMVGDKSP